MGRREDFYKTLRHEQPDRILADLGGSPQATFWGNTEGKLLEYLGLPKADNGGYVDERIQEYLDVDFRMCGCEIPLKSPLSRKISDMEYVDCWGITRRKVGHGWEITENPMRDITIDGLKKYPWPEPVDNVKGLIEGFAARAKYYYENTDYVVCAAHPVYGVFELGCWMVGFDEFLYRCAAEPEFVHAFFEIVFEYQKKISVMYYGMLGPYIHMTTSGDDFATQNAPFISPAMFDSLIAQYFKERIRYVKSFTDAAFLHHSCGNVYRLLPNLIACGVDIINPIQPCSADMAPAKLKNDFGSLITFHGGIDTQWLLPKGSADEVGATAVGLAKTLGCDGGFILAAAHCIQEDVPPENIVAMFRSVKEMGR